jgi:hypothetical protein
MLSKSSQFNSAEHVDQPPESDPLKTRERSEQNRIAALKRWGRTDGAAGTEPARKAWLGKFELEADPDGVLTPEERSVRAQRLRRAYMRQLALTSARNRRARNDRSPSAIPLDEAIDTTEKGK